jgi:dTDP-4-dehydrorhamnose reductase
VILLFGAGGQLGQAATHLAHRRSLAFRALSRSEADVADRSAVELALRELSPGLVVNAAAYTKVDAAESEIEEAVRSNAEGPAILAELCATSGIPLVHISTDYVFDGTKAGAYLETDRVAPLGVYGRTKAAGEEAIRTRHREHVILRTSWLYGAFGHNLLKTVLRLARERDELRFVADQRGCPTSTADVAEAILHIAPRLQAQEPVWGTYHFAGTGVTTWHGFVGAIVAAQSAITGRDPKVVPITSAEYPTPARRPANSELDSGLFAQTFGVRAEPWEKRVASTVKALLSEPEDATT